MKQIKEEIKKIFEEKNINIDNYNLDNFLKEQQQKFIRELINKENTLKIEYTEQQINSIIDKYKLYDTEELKSIIKNFFSKFSTEDLKKQLLKNIRLNLSNYKRIFEEHRNDNYFNIYKLNLEELKKLQYETLIDYEKPIIFKNLYCNYLGYKEEEFKENFNKYISLVFNEFTEEILKDYDAKFYLNGNIKIKFKNKNLHKKVKLTLLEELYKNIKQKIFINLNDYKEEYKNFINNFDRYFIFKSKEEHKEQLYIRLEINVFDYIKINNNIDTFFTNTKKEFNLKNIIDLSINELNEEYSTQKINNMLNEITEQNNKEKIIKLIRDLGGFKNV